ncbi:hypothetical protein [Cognatishimia sp.]|uniref:hypothetical protein n=1 Tax=Cognatishimia sp. TaxID=2211648 RepID=UPI003512FE8D|nr:hypothetical protein [Cognatishimia sp.]
MSTRSNIIIKSDSTNAEPTRVNTNILYKHHDGYPEGVGLDLVRHLVSYIEDNPTMSYPHIGNSNASDFIRNLPRLYEDTNSIHGDIEFIYVIEFMPNRITLSYTPACDKNGKIDLYLHTPEVLYEFKRQTEKSEMKHYLYDWRLKDSFVEVTTPLLSFEECKKIIKNNEKVESI